jgi:hypothetical protein
VCISIRGSRPEHVFTALNTNGVSGPGTVHPQQGALKGARSRVKMTYKKRVGLTQLILRPFEGATGLSPRFQPRRIEPPQVTRPLRAQDQEGKPSIFLGQRYAGLRLKEMANFPAARSYDGAN